MFFNTFLVSAVVTAVTLVIGFPVAWLLAILPGRWSSVLFGIVLLSMWTNLLARTYAWMVLLQRTGAINKLLMGMGLIDRPLPLVNNLVGVTIGMTYIMLPFVIMPLHATFKTIDPAILQAASLCGAGRWQAFRRVLVPLARGVAAGGLMVFVMSLGYFVTPALLGGTSNMMLAETHRPADPVAPQLGPRRRGGVRPARRDHGDLCLAAPVPWWRAHRPGRALR